MTDIEERAEAYADDVSGYSSHNDIWQEYYDDYIKIAMSRKPLTLTRLVE